ncbi:crAss001_48 related protein [Mycolicibacterium houstonense]|uniref:crAss001_48 related protein n=1 Tax=Mycolicibacterium houstonense TaxID=146021 RepID=UPI000836D694|nr:hypothetical protein [Mycolicibacterium houstonense]
MSIPADALERLRDEASELLRRLGKLADFISSERFSALHEHDRQDLTEQYKAMQAYALILNRRIRRYAS